MPGKGGWPFRTSWLTARTGRGDVDRLLPHYLGGTALSGALRDFYFGATPSGATVTHSIPDSGQSTSTTSTITTASISWAAGDAVHVAASINYSSTPGTWSLANATGLTWGTPQVDETTSDNRFMVWTAIASSAGSGSLVMTGAVSADIHAYQVRKATVTGGTLAWGSAQISPSTAATSITLGSLTGFDADDYQIATTAEMTTQSGGTWAGMTATPRAGWTNSQVNTATITNWCAFIHGQVSPLGGEATASVTGLSLPSGSPTYRMAVIPLQVTASGGGVTSGDGSSAGTSTASATGASTRAGAGSSAGIAAASATGQSNAAAVASSAGVATASAVGDTAGGVVVSGAGASAGIATAQAAGAATRAGAGASAGVGAANAVGASTRAAAASSAGIAAASAIGADASGGITSGVGTSSGSATASAVGASTNAAAGTSEGTSTAAGVSPAAAVTVRRGDDAGARERFWAAKAEDWLEERLEQVPAVAKRPKRARRRFVEAFLTQAEAMDLPRVDALAEMMAGLMAPQADYTDLAAAMMEYLARVRRERRKWRDERDIRALMALGEL